MVLKHADQHNQESAIEYDEAQVLERAVQGNADAFSQLYERYVGRIYNYVFYRTGSALDAEDLTARVFHRALGHISSYRATGVPFSAWLYRIAHNLVANYHRDNSRREEIALDDNEHLHPQGEHPEHELAESQDRELILRVIRRQPGERQQLLILKFVEHLSNAEVAQIMGRSEGAIKSLYHRTLLALRSELQKEMNLE